MTERESLSRVSEAAGVQAYARSATTRGRPSPAPAAPETAGSGTGGVAGEAAAGALDPSRLQSLVGEVQGQVQNVRRSLQFSVEEESGTTVIKVIDSETQEVIRQIPAEEMLSIASRLRAAAGGLLLADTV